MTLLDAQSGLLSHAEVAVKWDETFKWGSMLFPLADTWGEEPDHVAALGSLAEYEMQRPS